MIRVLKLALLFLIAVALPVQAATGVVLQVCGSNDQRAAQKVAADSAHHHTPRTASALHSHDVMMVMSHDDAASHPTGDSVGEQLKHSQPKCAACAVCCSSPAMTYASYVIANVVPSNPLLSLPDDSRFAGVVLEGPKRPPRELLA